MKKSPAIAIWYLKPCSSLFHRLFTVLHAVHRMTGLGRESTTITAQQSLNASCAKYQPISASKRGITPRYPPRAQPQEILNLVTVFDAILTRRQTREQLQCLYENLMSNNFRRTAVLKKI